MTPTTAIVTPWVDHPELVEDYMAAVADGPPDELLVIDNGSTPPLDFAAVRFEENRGFTAASNAGLAAARTDAVLFLNNDVVMTRPGWLDMIRDALEPGVLIGARLRYDRHGDVDGQPLPYLDGWCLAGMTADLRE
ncbi:MAG: glycosyltransferase, partial [Gemmatimonadaceae bacterium]|nr:glycosyltransferase [Gemmatimonadaceae bacterium]